MKRTTVFLLVGGLTLATVSIAEQPSAPRLDVAALKQMPRAERLAAQRAYKAELEAFARTHGWQEEAATAAPRAPRTKQVSVPGTSISYHSGTVVAGGNNSNMLGNQFDMASNPGGTACCFPVEASGSVTAATFSMISVSGGAAFFSMYDQVNGTTANAITSINIAAAAGANTFTFTTPINYVGSSFLAGMWRSGTTGDVPGIATGTVGGQGFHAVVINDVAATGFATVPNMNAAMGVSGNVSTPVELRNFSIE